MFRKLFYVVMIAAVVLGLPAFMPQADTVTPIGAQDIAGTHLVAPANPDAVETTLEAAGLLQPGASAADKEAAVKNYLAKKSDTWVNPQMMANAKAAEEGMVATEAAGVVTGKPAKVSVRVLAFAIDFSETEETFNKENVDTCAVEPFTAAGPRQGEILPPVGPAEVEEGDPYDNNTNWYTPAQTANPKFYENLIFGYKGAGRVRMDLIDPRDGKPGINLKGVTVQSYYDGFAGKGKVKLSGSVQGWFTLPHSEAYYGADTCNGGHTGGAFDADGHRVYAAYAIEDAVAEFNAGKTPAQLWKFWSSYDANKDEIIDTFWMIHAGMGQEGGGGVQGDDSIWSHSSNARYYVGGKGVKVYSDDPANPKDRDLYIGPYTFQPENAEVGVFSEEFGHNVFGLPDLYVSSGTEQGSIGFWSLMEAGAWGGWLGGSQPVGMPLWFKMIAWCGTGPCNWQYPMVVRNYDDDPETVAIGQLESTPGKFNRGVRINLPREFESVPNPVGTGKAAYTGTGDEIDKAISKDVEVPTLPVGATKMILNIPAQWDIEEDWDYGYVMVKGPADTDYVMLDDTGTYFTTTNPNGNNRGTGLTGAGADTLAFDLTAYAGSTVSLQLLYATDAAVSYTGWFVDDISLQAIDDTPANVGDPTLVSDFDGTAPLESWVNTDPGWVTVPLTNSYAQYYLVEWRNNTKFDAMAATSYFTAFSGTTDGRELWNVDRVPYNIPGALVYYRNTRYSNTYTQRGNYGDAPSYGPKYQLLAVDMNPMPIVLRKTADETTGYAYSNSRTSSYDAALTLQDSKAFTVHNATYGVVSVPAKTAVTKFDDAMGYYPGFFMDTATVPSPCNTGFLCFWNRDGSAVIPATGLYSTRITDYNGAPLTDLYGAGFGPSWLGSGNPGDDGVQYGVVVELLSKNKTGSQAVLKLSNALYGPGK